MTSDRLLTHNSKNSFRVRLIALMMTDQFFGERAWPQYAVWMSAPSCAMSILKPPWLLPCVLCELGSLHAKSTHQPAGQITLAAMHSA